MDVITKFLYFFSSDISYDSLMEKFGGYFFTYCIESGYDRLLRVLGGNLLDFLCNLDTLHDHLSSTYVGMQAPSFRYGIDKGSKSILNIRSHLNQIINTLYFRSIG